MTNSTKSADIGHSLRRIQSNLRDATQITSDVDDHLKDSTEQLKHILGLHTLIDAESKKGKGIMKTLKSRAFWDKHLYKLVFILYLIVVFYVITKHIGNLFYRIYDWICWTLSFILFWFPGFNYICTGYCSSNNQPNPIIDDDFNDDAFFKPDL